MSYKILIFFTIIAIASALVRIPVYKSENFRVTPKNIQIEKNLLSRKYNGFIDDAAVVEVLTDDKNEFYYGNIEIGTPPQTVTVAFDTSIGVLWVQENNICISISDFEPCREYPGFQSNLSSTYKDEDKPFDFSYDVGVLGNDVVNILGMKIHNQTFGIATGMVSNYVYEGVFGLGFQGLSQDNTVPPLYNMVSQGLLKNPVFSFYYANGPTNASIKEGGELILGGSDSSLYTGKMTYLPVIGDKYWEFKVPNINMNGMNLCHNCEAIVDTNTFLIGAPLIASTVFKALVNSSETTATGLSIYDCSTFSSLPDIEIEINGVKFYIPPALYTTTVQLYNDYGNLATVCVTLVEYSGYNYWIFGEPFLKKVYTEFNFSQKTIGFASLSGSPPDYSTPAAHPTTTSAPSTTKAFPPKKSTCNK